MNRIKLITSILAVLLMVTACNNHNDDPGGYYVVPIRMEWFPAYNVLAWNRLPLSDKMIVAELTEGIYVINSGAELAAHNEYGLFDDPLAASAGSIDFRNQTLLVAYHPTAFVPGLSQYQVVFDYSEGWYELETRYTYSENTTLGPELMCLNRTAVVVDKLGYDDIVQPRFYYSVSDWDWD